MTKYTTTSLIEFLEKFPRDTPIKNDLALMWNYNDNPPHLRVSKTFLDEDDFRELSIKEATFLCIFEGDWEDGSVTTDYSEYQD